MDVERVAGALAVVVPRQGRKAGKRSAFKVDAQYTRLVKLELFLLF